MMDDLEKGRAAPEGPPHDLVRSRGQEPAEASQDNLSTSHETDNRITVLHNQGEVDNLIDPSVQALLTSCLSTQRLSRYAPAAEDGAASASDLYLWNCELCEAFYLPLHIAEIACRNTIHSALLFRDPSWYENQTFLNILDAYRRSELEKAITDERAQHGGAMDAHHLVSALTMGFWEHLTTNRFARFLFNRGIQKNFRHAPMGKKTDDLHGLIESVRRWRNRIAHHNAIFDKGPSAKYQDALELISWTSPPLAEWVAARCQVNQIINRRPGRV